MKREYSILNYFNMRALFLGIGTAKILMTSKEYFFFALLFGMFLGILILSIFKMELHNKWTSILSSSVLFVIAILLLINMISSMYLTEMPKLLIGIPILLVVLYILSKKEIVIYRISTLFIIINMFFFILTFISLFRYVKWGNFGYTGTPFTKVLYAGVQYAFFSTVPTFITRDKEVSQYSLIKTYVLSSLTLGILFFFTFGILGPELIQEYRYPEYIMLKKVTFFETLANVENIISFVWIFDILMLLVSCGNTIKKALGKPLLTYAYMSGLLLFVSFISKYYQTILFLFQYTFFLLIGIFLLLYLFNRKRKERTS